MGHISRRSWQGGISRWLVVVLAASVGLGYLIVSTSAQEDSKKEEEPQQEKPTAETRNCRTAKCHVGIGNKKVAHGPVAQDKCMACHQYDRPKDHTFKLLAKNEALCNGCHILPMRNVVHKPVKDGQCTACHDPHGSDHRMILVADAAKGLCVECHKIENFGQKKFVHGPVAAGACIVCHDSHSSWNPKLLAEKPQALCLGCHAEVAVGDADDRHMHEPVKEDCGKCHDPHASDFKFNLREPAPQLCISSCHEPIRKQLAEATVLHGAVTTEGGCGQCHKAHSSQLPHLQRADQSEMCLSCHNKEIETPDGRTLVNMAAWLKDNPQHHRPIEEGGCSACHKPHAGDLHDLLVKEYPPEFYAPFSEERYALCFECHRPELVKDKHGVGLTRFRDADVNLHWLHVNREKGRTCRACHEVHASRHPFHIRDAVPFGTRNWMLEIRYEKTETGGQCTPGCHKLQGYDHGQKDPVPSSNETSDAVPSPAQTGAKP